MSKSNFSFILDRPTRAFDILVRICSFIEVEHWHHVDAMYPCWIFYWNPTAGARIRYGEQEFELAPDHVVMIPPFTRYSTLNQQSFQHFFIHFSVPEPFNRVRRGVFLFSAEEVEKFFSSLRSRPDADLQPVLLRSMLYHYLGQIPAEKFLKPGESILSPGICRAIEFMSASLKHPLRNRELCRKAGLGINEFYRKFQQELNMTPKKYLLSLRMEQARTMLLHSDSSMEEIAEQTGYADRFQFSKAFRNFYSTPPAAYRKHCKSRTFE